MAIFEKEKDAKEYIVLLDITGEVVAYINPVKTVSNKLMVDQLVSKGLNAEIKTSAEAKTSLAL